MIASVDVADRKNKTENFKLNTVSLSFKRFQADLCQTTKESGW